MYLFSCWESDEEIDTAFMSAGVKLAAEQNSTKEKKGKLKKWKHQNKAVHLPAN